LVAREPFLEAALHPVDDHAVFGNADRGMFALFGRDVSHL
jgi:hypothetical protein